MHPKAIEVLTIVEDVHSKVEQTPAAADQILRDARLALGLKISESDQVEEQRREAYLLLCSVATNFLVVCEQFHLDGQPLVFETGFEHVKQHAEAV